MEKDSGIPYHHAQVAAARVFLGKEGYASGKQKVAIRVADDAKTSGKDHGQGEIMEEVPLPQTIDEAMEILRKFGK